MKVVSLFAGCGGLDLGFKQAGFNVIWANEYDETIHATYELNHPTTFLNKEDLRKVSSNQIPECDGIIGGPPCQSWSEGGKGLGFEDPRGKLILEYIRIIKEKRPKFFLIENVRGILDKKHSKALNLFINLLRNAGYEIYYDILNAADFMVPQERYRVFFVGFRSELNINFKFPQSYNSPKISLRKSIGDLNKIPIPYFKEPTIINLECSNHDYYTGPFDSKYMARNRVRGWDEISFTIQAQARNIPIHPQAPKMIYISKNIRAFNSNYFKLYRRLSVRECARIQTFPDSFYFIYKDIKDGYKMVGNAVPPRLAKMIAIQIRNCFEKNYKIPKILLVGCFKNALHKEWIITNKLYNVRLGNRTGSLEKTNIRLVPNQLLLYNKNRPQEYILYHLDPAKQIIANKEFMIKKEYPNIKGEGNYIIYQLKEKVADNLKYDVETLRKKFAPKTKNNAPFFVKLY